MGKSLADRINWSNNVDLAAVSAAGRAATARRKARPSCGNPAMNDREYSAAESEYLAAVAAYQQRTGARFLTACEYRNVLLGLGYARVDP